MADESRSQGSQQSPEPDDSEPTLERQAELRAAYEANITAGRPPYAGVKSCTASEVRWILHERDWGGERSAGDKGRVDLSHAILAGVDLSGFALDEANLSHAILIRAKLNRTYLWRGNLISANLERVEATNADMSWANLTGANLEQANLGSTEFSHAKLSDIRLRGATLSRTILRFVNLERADVSGANFFEADLSGALLDRVDLRPADLSRANLSGVDLSEKDLGGACLNETNLSGANLTSANLSGAQLRGARMDAATILSNVTLDSRVQVADLAWNGVLLTRVDWVQVPILGDELAIKEAQNRKKRVAAYHEAARAYRGLAIALREQGVIGFASRYRLREQRLERQALLLEGKLFGWLFSALLDLLAGYGERPGRTFVAYLTVVLSFAALYYGVSHFLETQLSKLTWDEAVVLSLTSFHGRGFFPGFLSLGDWGARLGALEAVIGLFIELIFIATFSRRFLGN